MKTMKAILSGKGLPHRGEKGFTLVELLIVLAILAVLAAVVIPNVTGMLGKGQKQSYETDAKTIQSGVMAYIIDVRNGGDPADAGHYIPVVSTTGLGIKQTATDDTLYRFTLGASPTAFPNAYEVTRIESKGASGWTPVITFNVAVAAIQMGWLAEKQGDDPGPYLDKIPASAGSLNGATTTPGSYVWVVDYSGKVFAFYATDVVTSGYVAGYAETYP